MSDPANPSQDSDDACFICGLTAAEPEFVAVGAQSRAAHAPCLHVWARRLVSKAAHAAVVDAGARKERHSWMGGKLKSAVSEFACRQHFEALGYSVESLGIEHTAPIYLSTRPREHVKCPPFFKTILHALPDFIASRVSPEASDDDAEAAPLQAFLVEAKYRSKADLNTVEASLYNGSYKHLLDAGAEILFYVIVREARIGKVRQSGHLFLNRSWNRGWKTPSELSGDPRFVGQRKGDTLGSLYIEDVEPTLRDIWSPPMEDDKDSQV